jgi:hypothetical protein
MHIENMEIEKAKNNLYQNRKNYSENFTESGSGSERTQWAWSNGQTHEESGEWLKDLVTERGLKALIDQKVEKEIEINQISNEAKVKTMYQKTLQNSAKTYLQEVHEESILNMNLHAEKAIGGSSRLDERREMLRLKKLQQKSKE